MSVAGIIAILATFFVLYGSLIIASTWIEFNKLSLLEQRWCTVDIRMEALFIVIGLCYHLWFWTN